MDIQTLYQDVIQKICKLNKVNIVSKTLLKAKTNENRVSYVYRTIENLDVFPEVTRVEKDTNVSTYYRNLGNLYYKRSDNYRAWQLYNIALLYAPLDSDCYVLALSNRSAVFFSMEQYGACLNDLKLIFGMEYPRNLNEKLIKRKQACKEILKIEDSEEESEVDNGDHNEKVNGEHNGKDNGDHNEKVNGEHYEEDNDEYYELGNEVDHEKINKDDNEKNNEKDNTKKTEENSEVDHKNNNEKDIQEDNKKITEENMEVDHKNNNGKNNEEDNEKNKVSDERDDDNTDGDDESHEDDNENDVENYVDDNENGESNNVNDESNEGDNENNDGNVDYDYRNYFSLNKIRDDLYLCSSPKVKVKTSVSNGVHIVATEDIEVGEVLAVEAPYFSLLQKPQYLFTCNHCLSRCPNLMPCPNCCYVLYCGEDCAQEAWYKYHRFECEILTTLMDMKFTKLELLALRTVLIAYHDSKSWSRLKDTIYQADLYSTTEYRGCVYTKSVWVFASHFYPAIHVLCTNLDKRSVSDIFQKCVSACVLLSMLKKTEIFDQEDKIDKTQMYKIAGGLLLHHLMTAPTNMHGISTNIETPDGSFTEEISIASAPYGFLSLLNHSCAPNVVRFCKLGTADVSLIALRPIKKGHQLFDNYGVHHAIHDYETRQEAIKSQYKFICRCEACHYGWPTYPNLPPAMNLPKDIMERKEELLNSENFAQLKKGDLSTAKNIYVKLCVLATDLEPYAPCVELAECQESLKQCLGIFVGFIPYQFSKTVEWGPHPPKNLKINEKDLFKEQKMEM